jgi:hypothetical protein
VSERWRGEGGTGVIPLWLCTVGVAEGAAIVGAALMLAVVELRVATEGRG